jgi:hypothetical protein
MSGFDDVIERGSKTSNASNFEAPKRSVPKEEVPSILEIVENMNLGGLSNNLNPEMKEKVLVPLANLLDKYGISESLGDSTTAQAGMGLFSLLGDVAPVIKGLAEYISGQRNSLNAEDREFLERIKNSQSNSEFSDLFVSDSTEEQTPEKTQKPNLVGPNGENLGSINLNLNEVDWWSVMGVENPEEKKIRQMPQARQTYMAKDANNRLPTFGSAGEKPTIQGLPTLEDLASEIGMSLEDLNNPENSESQSVNAGEVIGVDLESIDFTMEESEGLLGDIDLDEIYNIDFESED